MEVGTPKGKVSAIRKVVGLSSLGYLDRLDLVKKILGESFVVDSPPPAKPTRSKREIEVYQYDLSMNLIAIHKSIVEAMRAMKVSRNCIKRHGNNFRTEYQQKPIRGMWHVAFKQK